MEGMREEGNWGNILLGFILDPCHSFSNKYGEQKRKGKGYKKWTCLLTTVKCIPKVPPPPH